MSEEMISTKAAKKPTGLRARMGRLFAIQIAVISIATLIGIYITQLIIEDLLTRQALTLEAEHFWARYGENPSQPLPDVYNMRGYMVAVAADTGQAIDASELPGTSGSVSVDAA